MRQSGVVPEERLPGFVGHGQDAIVPGFAEGIHRPYRQGQRAHKCQAGKSHEAVAQTQRGDEQGQGDEKPNQREMVQRRVDVFRPVQKLFSFSIKRSRAPKSAATSANRADKLHLERLLFLNFGVLNHLHAVLLDNLALEGDGLRG